MANKIRLPRKELVEQWKEEKVIRWLKRVQLEDCIPAFEIRHIDGVKLLELTEQKLFTYQDLKIKHRKQISKCVQECKSQASNAKRIARTIKHRHKSPSDALENNGDCDSDDDYCDWGSDFEDESDEEGDWQVVCELNNNSIVQSACDTPEQNSKIKLITEKPPGKFIPKPPDVPVIPTSINGPTVRKTWPPLKRPDSQPPPPPVPQVPSQDVEQEDYEIPIVSTTPVSCENSECSGSFHNVISSEFSPETYELIEPPEETYEMVDAPSPIPVVEKPLLPPRIPLSSGAPVSPPPLPQKPKKIKDNLGTHEKSDGVRTFTRPRHLSKSEAETESNQSPALPNVGFISSLMGRRTSTTTPSSSPQAQHKASYDGSLSSNHSVVSSSDGLSSRSSSPDKDAFLTVGRSSFINTGSVATSSIIVKKTTPLPPLPPREPVSDETAQNMATRPLPPVPVPKEVTPSNSHKENLQNRPWFHDIERQKAEDVVKELMDSGSFVVRPSKRAGAENPFSITIFHDEKLFHLNIRQRPDDVFALGKEKPKEKEDLHSYPWYHEIERQKAEEVVKNLNESGSYVVRPSNRGGIDKPFSLTIFYNEKLFHLNIRHRPDDTFALGKEKKKEKTFASVADLIAFHQTEPILLTSRGQPAGKTILSKYPEKT